MEPKFKVGDKVKVTLKDGYKYRCGLATEMLRMQGDILTIKSIIAYNRVDEDIELKTDGCIYLVEENAWKWTSAMVELLVNDKIEKSLTINLNKAREIFNKDTCSEDMKELLLSNFTIEELTKKELPNSWKEFCNNHPRKHGECWIQANSFIEEIDNLSVGTRYEDRDKNILPNRKTAEAVLTLCQLIQLRDCYNDGWKPNWSNEFETKYSIKCVGGKFETLETWYTYKVLVFKSSELRDKFLNNFKDLIEQAKELI